MGACIFNTSGSRMFENDGRMVSNFALQALKTILLMVYGEGSQTRSFCYVSDLIEGLTRLIEGIGRSVILENPTEYTILVLAQIIQKMVNPNAEILNQPLPQDDPRRRRPDTTLAKTRLGWAPTIQLHEGLRLLVDDFRERLGAPAFSPPSLREVHAGVPRHEPCVCELTELFTHSLQHVS
ncbi:MAG: GDP-mannose 4,6-dehydratase [Cyanobacteria bacterium P01_A01_bin.3]